VESIRWPIRNTDEKKLFRTNEILICSYEILSTVYVIEKVKIYNHYGKLKSVVLFFIIA